MSAEHTDLAGCIARWWVARVVRHARTVAVGILIVTVLTGFYVARNLDINTNDTDMLSAELPFRQNAIAVDKAFPQLSDNLVVVLDGRNPDRLADAADVLVAELRKHDAVLGTVFDPASEPLFRKNGLLYKKPDELNKLLDRLIDAQPFLGRLWSDPTIVGLFGAIELVLNESDGSNASAAADLFREIGKTIDAQVRAPSPLPQPLPTAMSWRRLFSDDAETGKLEFRSIILHPRLDYESLGPGGVAMDLVRDIIGKLDLERKYNVRVRLTGSVALEYDELDTLRQNMGLASLLSFVFVGALLVWGMRSGILVTSTLITLFVGLVLTAGWATLAVGELNLISVAFAVLFIGLGEDFGVHFCLRYREEANAGIAKPDGLATTAQDVGGALALSAATAAIGFLAFVPTDYRGLAELGIIAGGGMFVALFTNMTLLPALLAIWPTKSKLAEPKPGGADSWDLRKIAKPGSAIVGIFAIASLFALPGLRFDFDPMNLRNPNSESIKTLNDMMAAGSHGPYTIDILTPDLASADRMAAKLKTLPSVDDAVTLSNYVPTNQGDKIAAVESAAFTLLPALSIPPIRETATDEERLGAISGLRRALARFLDAHPESGLTLPARALLKSLADYATQTRLDAAKLAALDRTLTGSLPARLRELKDALEPETVAIETIPSAIRERQIAADGRAIIEVIPKDDIREREKLKVFVRDVRTVEPHATGSPVVILEAGNAVVKAFIQAGLWSLAAITLLTFALLRNAREILFIYVPLFLAAILTIGISVAFDMPFNFANVIVLPLLFGLGIASGIHIVLSERHTAKTLGVAETTTPRAVFFSTLTTIASFGTVALSDHPGTASMGILLTVAILLTLVCSLTVLPMLLQKWPIAHAPDKRRM
jgi:hopanoid biosynthesis associated RND transporter like protein HpnN